MLVKLETIAVEIMAEDHDASPVMSMVVLSDSIPVAANCCFKPIGTDGLVGVTEIDANVAGVMVRVELPVIAPNVALIIVSPTARGDAFP